MSQGANREIAASLAAKGWTRRFTALGPRLSEMVEFYGALGYEVRLEPATSAAEALADACEQCMVLSLARTIYTRWPGEPGGAGQ